MISDTEITMPSKKEASKVFIGFIPNDVTEDKLRSKLEKYGKLSSLYYMPDTSEQPRGWAFVSFEEKASGTAAIVAINGKPYFEGSNEPCKAFFVAARHQCDYVRAASNVSTGPVTSAGFWQRFLTSEGIPYYYNSKTGQSQWQRPQEVMNTQEDKRNEASSTFGPPGSNLFVFHLPSDWTDAHLVEHFKEYGSVISARVQRDGSGRNRGFGFISYDNPASALEAIKGMNGFGVSGKYLKVQLKKGEEHYLNHSNSGLTNTNSDLSTRKESNINSPKENGGDNQKGSCESLASTLQAEGWAPLIPRLSKMATV